MFVETTAKNETGRSEKVYRRNAEARGTNPRPATISPGMLMNLALNESIPRPCRDLEITLMDTLMRDSFQRDGVDDDGDCVVHGTSSRRKFRHDGKLSPNVWKLLGRIKINF